MRGRACGGARDKCKKGTDLFKHFSLLQRIGDPLQQLLVMRDAHTEHKISSLPVVGDDGQLVGLVTGTDFIRIAEKALRGESPSEFRD